MPAFSFSLSISMKILQQIIMPKAVFFFFFGASYYVKPFLNKANLFVAI
jgi:hypothetical protein